MFSWSSHSLEGGRSGSSYLELNVELERGNYGIVVHGGTLGHVL